MSKNIYDHIEINKVKTIFLVLLFPAFLFLIIIALLYAFGLFAEVNPGAQQGYFSVITSFLPMIFLFVFGLGFLWLLISYFAGAKMILKAANAVELENFENSKQIKRIVENIAITAGLPCPKVYIINDDSLNAFATGRDPNHAAITLTTGIIGRLNKQELEGVIAHEMSHIGNRDIRLMLLIVAGIGFCTFMGHFLLRGSIYAPRGKNKSSGIVFAMAAAFIIFGYLLAPLLRLAVSRQREYQADATACLLTRNPFALASALRKISQDARVEVLDSQPSVAAMCISSPLKKPNSLFNAFSGLIATHPPIDKRIEKLEAMGA